MSFKVGKMKLFGSSTTILGSKLMSLRKWKKTQTSQSGVAWMMLLFLGNELNRAHALLPLLSPKSPSPGKGQSVTARSRNIPQVWFGEFVLQAIRDVEASDICLSKRKQFRSPREATPVLQWG